MPATPRLASVASPDPRWERTRRALVDAGRRVFSRRGVEAATVLEIVREAGVSQPSFYNHFASKQELVEVIAADFFEGDVAVKLGVLARVSDPAEAIAINAVHTLRVAARDPAVAWVLLRAGSLRDLRQDDGTDNLERAIRGGVRSGRFRVTDARVAAAAIRGAAWPLLQDILKRRTAAAVERCYAELVLRMLGIDHDEAAGLAARAAAREGGGTARAPRAPVKQGRWEP